MIPDIEFVLGMVGSTIGSAVGIIFPSLMFIRLTTKNTTERLLAQLIFVVGVAMMVVGTYSNLQEANRSMESIMEEKNMHIEQVEKSIGIKAPDVGNSNAAEEVATKHMIAASPVAVPDTDPKKPAVAADAERREPVVPHPPKDEDNVAHGEDLREETTSKERRNDSLLEKDTNDGERKTSNTKNTEVDKLEEGLEKKVEKVVQKEKELEVRERKAEELLQELQKQKDEQKQLLEEQKEVLQQMKDHVNEGQAQVSNNEVKATVVLHEDKPQVKSSEKMLPASEQLDKNVGLPKPSPRGPMLFPDENKNREAVDEFARVESQVPQGKLSNHGNGTYQSNLGTQGVEPAERLRLGQQQRQDVHVHAAIPEPEGHKLRHDSLQGQLGKKQQSANRLSKPRGQNLTNDRVGPQRPVKDFVGEERLYVVPNRGGNKKERAMQQKQSQQDDPNFPKTDGKGRADPMDWEEEVGVGRDLKSARRQRHVDVWP